MKTVIEIIDAAMGLMPIRKRGADDRLYSALVLALQASEICLKDKAQEAVLRKAIVEMPKGNKNRQYVARGSNVFQCVCRYIFFGEENYANISRYSIAIKQAHESGVHSNQLLKRLNDGGVNQFYLSRPLHNDLISTKCIRLDRQITHNKSDKFTLVLKRNPDNSYKVMKHE